MKKYELDGTVKAFELWNPGNPRLSRRVRGSLGSPPATKLTAGSSSSAAGTLGTYKILPPAGGTGLSVVLGPPTVFTKANVKKFNFLDDVIALIGSPDPEPGSRRLTFCNQLRTAVITFQTVVTPHR